MNNGKPVTHRTGAMGKKALYIYTPQEDITPMELSRSMELMTYGMAVQIRISPPEACDAIYDSMNAETKRHWDRHELSQIAVPKQKPRIQMPPGSS